MTPAAAQDRLNQLLHAWVLDIESVPFPVIAYPEGQR